MDSGRVLIGNHQSRIHPHGQRQVQRDGGANAYLFRTIDDQERLSQPRESPFDMLARLVPQTQILRRVRIEGRAE